MMPGNERGRASKEAPATIKGQATNLTEQDSNPILQPRQTWPLTAYKQPINIARGAAGDCCVLCGKVGVPLLVEHGCVPNVEPEELFRVMISCSSRFDELWRADA
jgi:hypothetical protein